MTNPSATAPAGQVHTATPAERFKAATVIRYEHGGGRVFYTDAAGTRELIADLYREDTREFIIDACTTHSQLLATLREMLAAELTPMPSYEAGKAAQDAWADRRAKARNDAAALIAKCSP